MTYITKINIELEYKSNNIEELIKLIKKINLEESIKDIFHILQEKIDMNNIKIIKYDILNTCDNYHKITDVINIENNKLIDFMVTILKDNKKYIIQKEINNYTIKVFDESIDSLTKAYFEINDQVQFVKRLEKQK